MNIIYKWKSHNYDNSDLTWTQRYSLIQINLRTTGAGVACTPDLWPPPHPEQSPVWLESWARPPPLAPCEAADRAVWRWRFHSWNKHTSYSNITWRLQTDTLLIIFHLTLCSSVCCCRFQMPPSLSGGPASSSWCWSSESPAATQTHNYTQQTHSYHRS